MVGLSLTTSALQIWKSKAQVEKKGIWRSGEDDFLGRIYVSVDESKVKIFRAPVAGCRVSKSRSFAPTCAFWRYHIIEGASVRWIFIAR